MGYNFDFIIRSSGFLALMFGVGALFVLLGAVPKMLGNELLFNLGVLFMLLAAIFYFIKK